MNELSTNKQIMAAPMKLSKIVNFLTKNVLFSKVLPCGSCRCSSSAATANQPKIWQLHSAVCLQRYPLVSSKPNEIEKKYQEYNDLLEDNNSYLSDHEVATIEEQKRKEELAQMTEQERKRAEDKSLLTLQEVQDRRQKELDEFEFTDTLTDADRANDESSYFQKLDKKLVLIVKQKWTGESEPQWSFPQSSRLDGESMREAAERTLMTKCGESLDALFVGNAPCGFYEYKLPTSYSGPDYGVKVFFFKANHTEGEIEGSDNILDHKWVTFDDLPNYVSKQYHQSVKKFLVWS